MKLFTNKFIFLIPLFSFSFYSSSSILIEPYLGTGFSVLSDKPIAMEETIENLKGIEVNELLDSYKQHSYFRSNVFGGRFGYKKLGLGISLDLSILHSNAFDSNFKTQGFSLFIPGIAVSYKLPILFYVYASISPKISGFKTLRRDVFEASQASGNSCSIDKGFKPLESILCASAGSCENYFRIQGSGIKVGGSYISIPFMNVNLEYQPLFLKDESCESFWLNNVTAQISLRF